jgi:hypothetical protein
MAKLLEELKPEARSRKQEWLKLEAGSREQE